MSASGGVPLASGGSVRLLPSLNGMGDDDDEDVADDEDDADAEEEEDMVNQSWELFGRLRFSFPTQNRCLVVETTLVKFKFSAAQARFSGAKYTLYARYAWKLSHSRSFGLSFPKHSGRDLTIRQHFLFTCLLFFLPNHI